MNKGYAFGVACALCGGLCLSTGGILVRNLEHAEGWEVLFYRSLTFFSLVLLLIVFKYGAGTWRAFRAVGGRGLIVAVALGVGSIFYIFALIFTTVANVVFIIGAAPLVTAAFGWLLLRERISTFGFVAMLGAFLGLGLMFADGFVAGRWLGNLMAFVVVLCFAVMLVTLRHGKKIDMLPATGMAGLVAAGIAGLMATDLALSSRDLSIALLLGSVQYGAGFILFTIATRYIAAAEVALFSLTEAVFAPIWVWIGVGEVPSVLTLWGSSVVLGAVILHGVVSIRSRSGKARHGA